MPRVEILREDLPQHENTFRAVADVLGVLPNSTLTMARWPELMEAFAALNAVVMAERRVSGVLKQMVAAVVSSAAGCAYCQAHTTHVGEVRGLDQAKVAALWDYQMNPLFTDAERAALRGGTRAGGHTERGDRLRHGSTARPFQRRTDRRAGRGDSKLRVP